MKIIKTLKFAGLMALVLGMAVGCAGGPAEPETAQEETQSEQAAQEAISESKALLEEAESKGVAWRDTADLIAQAEEAEKAGNYDEAIALANQAARQAENAIAQQEEQAAAAEAEASAAAEAEAGVDSYTVAPGDNLWDISGKESIYGNPFYWPLIYKANSDKIRDADLIYPGQELAIDRAASSAEMDAAARHARTRGAWSVGVVEDSDRAYLSGN